MTLSSKSVRFDLARQLVSEAMRECRSRTLSLFNAVDYETFCHQPHPDFSPIGWHLGHIAYTESVWILQRCAGYAPLFPQYHRLFAQDGLPKGDRVHLPSIEDVLLYLETVRFKTFQYLQTAPLDEQQRLWQWLLQHESQHAETIALVLALMKDKTEQVSTSQSTESEMVEIPAGAFIQGSDAIDAQDNERPAHSVYLDRYWIDRTLVTVGQYRSFIESGGYQTERWWTPEGWQWRQANSITHPLYQSSDPNHPVCGVSWYEADAYARSIGKRLPTEAEWEKAASWNAATGEKLKYPWGNEFDPLANRYDAENGTTTALSTEPQPMNLYGCSDMIGNVWEWTNTWFEGYPSFESYPYPGYSQQYFDGAHRVLKGGSWATFKWAMRSTFRNWYHPHVREVFAGFRCVRD